MATYEEVKTIDWQTNQKVYDYWQPTTKISIDWQSNQKVYN